MLTLLQTPASHPLCSHICTPPWLRNVRWSWHAMCLSVWCLFSIACSFIVWPACYSSHPEMHQWRWIWWSCPQAWESKGPRQLSVHNRLGCWGGLHVGGSSQLHLQWMVCFSYWDVSNKSKMKAGWCITNRQRTGWVRQGQKRQATFVTSSRSQAWNLATSPCTEQKWKKWWSIIIVSEVISKDCRAVVLHAYFRIFTNWETFCCSPSAKWNLDWSAWEQQ